MDTLESLLPIAHLLGMGLALGSATAKLTLLLKSMTNHAFVQTFITVAKTLTHLILIGTALLVISGIIWLVLGYPFDELLIIKLVLVGLIVVLGATLDKLLEPKFNKLAPQNREAASAEFIRIQKLYMIVETTATGLYYIIVIIWTLGI